MGTHPGEHGVRGLRRPPGRIEKAQDSGARSARFRRVRVWLRGAMLSRRLTTLVSVAWGCCSLMHRVCSSHRSGVSSASLYMQMKRRCCPNVSSFSGVIDFSSLVPAVPAPGWSTSGPARWCSGTPRCSNGFWAPEYALVPSASPKRPMIRAAWLAALPEYQSRSLTMTGLTVRVLNDLALASFVGALTARVRGAERRGSYFLTDVWRRQNVMWRMIARYSSRPEEVSSSTRALEYMAGDSAGQR